MSINRSRLRWVHEVIFEKYWSKAPNKKKKDGPEEKRDPRPPMTRVGTCKIMVEPHVFDASIYVVREQTPHVPQPQGERQFVQYGPAGTSSTYTPQYHQSGHAQLSPFQRTPQYGGAQVLPKSVTPLSKPGTPVPTTQPSTGTAAYQTTVPKATPASQPATPATNSAPKPPFKASTVTKPTTTQPIQTPVRTPTTTAPAARTFTTTTAQTIPPRPQARPPARPPAPSTSDPVIQMLAQRASADPELKRIMKIVATGSANMEELAFFQRHIDEFQQVVESKKVKEATTTAVVPAQSSPAVSSIQNRGPASVNTPHAAATTTIRPPTTTYQTPNRVPLPPVTSIHRPLYTNTPPTQMQQKLKPMAPPPLHVLIEFALNSADRFLFPKHSIVELVSRDCMLVSFLVVKKPSQLLELDSGEVKKYRKKADKAEQAADGKEDEKSAESSKQPQEEEKEVYQPITIRLESPSDPSLFSTIIRHVAPADTVQKRMREIAARCNMAEKKYLALRLPKETKEREAKLH
jgi:hypothetical protein